MTTHPADFEVNFRGQTFLTVRKGQLDVTGTDLPSDLANISRLIGILSDVLDSALTAQCEAAVQPTAKHLADRHANVYPLPVARRAPGAQNIRAV